MTTYWCEYAAVPSGQGVEVAESVIVRVEGQRITAVEVGSAPGDAQRLAGLTIPGIANCHSHAFHRALRGRTQQGKGSFWTWREQMYAVAATLDPDSYYWLARATYREMVLAGITSVGEFHYLHHSPDGSPYDEPNVMGAALIAAARDAGLRIALLDTCYLSAGFDKPPQGPQVRFSDESAQGWADRASALADQLPADDDGVVLGAAVHSVRAVPAADLPVVAGWADERGAPLHTHLSEQVAENDACLEAHGCTPTELLDRSGVLGDRTTVVHATHLTERDTTLLGESRTTTCFCPTTERDLGDGIGPAVSLQRAGSRLTLGSDNHAVVDPYEEMRALELDERLARQARGHWSAEELLAAATTAGHASLGFADAGRIQPGARADLVTLDLESVRTAGSGPRLETAVFCASAADVVQVVCDGRLAAVRDERAAAGRQLSAAIDGVWATA